MKKLVVIFLFLFGSQSTFCQDNNTITKEIEKKELNNEVVSTLNAGHINKVNHLKKYKTGHKIKSWKEYQKEYKKGKRSSRFLEKYIIARKREIKGPIPSELKFQLLNAYYLEKKKKLRGKL